MPLPVPDAGLSGGLCRVGEWRKRKSNKGYTSCPLLSGTFRLFQSLFFFLTHSGKMTIYVPKACCIIITISFLKIESLNWDL